MKLLFFSYWGAHEGLTASTVLPHLQILSEIPGIEEIHFVSVEREGKKITPLLVPDRVSHYPIYSKNYPIGLLNKFSDTLLLRRRLLERIKTKGIDTLICRSSPAGGIGYYLHKKTDVPFYVESYEPHADYMYEAGAWQTWNPKYLIQKMWEQQAATYAEGLMPVTHNFKRHLISKGVPQEKIHVMPCCTPLDAFEYREDERRNIRSELGLSSKHILGIYVGKFGANYYQQEAFALFSKTQNFFGKEFRLLILSPQDQELIREGLHSASFPEGQYWVKKVAHQEVANYLSAADFAYSTVKTTPSRIYCSAIKHGEYWANGLPIMMTSGIGEDSELIEKEGIGSVFHMEDEDSIQTALQKLSDLLQHASRKELAEKITPMAYRYRNFDIIREVYTQLFQTNTPVKKAYT